MSKKIQWTIETAEEHIGFWQKVKAIIERSDVNENDDINTKVYKLYLKHTSLDVVAKILRDEGVCVPSSSGSRKIQTNDISEIVQGENISDTELQDLVRSIFNRAKKIMDARWN